jgi:hypothetical protein
MKNKLLLALACICITHAAYAGDNATASKTNVKHHVQFLFGNYSGQSTLSSHDAYSYKLYTAPGLPGYGVTNSSYYSRPSFSSMYSLSAGFLYKADFTAKLSLRTGLIYYVSGSHSSGTAYDECATCPRFPEYVLPNYKRTLFVSYLLMPIHFVMYHQLHKGRLVFSAGPDIYLPINVFGTEKFQSTDQALSSKTENIHYHLSGENFFKGGSLGFTAGLGYEVKLKGKLSLELMPDFRILNMAPFDFQGQGTGIYKNYIFNTALGLSTYLTFY